ncbi:PREDICTED: uncharacterized protein LOC106113531 [Papilio xuthus]|uniref:Uncharacterized protein LOC106113531 n=1 Tax=Papilio xuthus TaxID=66420 RepID=A0AAJ6YZ53_PAPXU|nr:PREDICTED: uncharacterized protein LOC106113531 [Papilio xuthus]
MNLRICYVFILLIVAMCELRVSRAVSQSKLHCRRDCSEHCLLYSKMSGACLHRSCQCGGQNLYPRSGRSKAASTLPLGLQPAVSAAWKELRDLFARSLSL